MKLYRFTARQRMNDFFDTGAVRIGHLHGFRDTVAHGPHRGDAEEGMRQLHRRVDERGLLGRGETGDPFIDSFIKVENPNANVWVGNSYFQRAENFDDGYVFCMCEQFVEADFCRWHERFGADACYEIEGESFVDEIVKTIQDLARPLVCAPVQYVNRNFDYRDPRVAIPSALLKPEEYSWQLERRMVWEPTHAARPLAPIDTEVPSAIRFARPYALFEGGGVRLL